jgi:hypothetical protein
MYGVDICVNPCRATEREATFSFLGCITRCDLAFDRPREENLQFHKKMHQLDWFASATMENRKRTTRVMAEEIEHPKPAIMVKKSSGKLLGTVPHPKGRGITCP